MQSIQRVCFKAHHLPMRTKKFMMIRNFQTSLALLLDDKISDTVTTTTTTTTAFTHPAFNSREVGVGKGEDFADENSAIGDVELWKKLKEDSGIHFEV